MEKKNSLAPGHGGGKKDYPLVGTRKRFIDQTSGSKSKISQDVKNYVVSKAFGIQDFEPIFNYLNGNKKRKTNNGEAVRKKN